MFCGIILSFIFCGLKTMSLTLREFEDRVIRRIFAPKTGELRGGRRKWHSEELHHSLTSLGIIRVIKLGM
jgi:hypothetical protein